MTDQTSVRRSHIAFPEIGDERTKAKIPILIRSANVDYPMSLLPAIDALADSEGTSPKKPWITFDRPELTIQPGKSERLVLTLSLPPPQFVEAAIADGQFTALLNFQRTDLGQSIELRRYQPISGADDDEPVNRVTFNLRRPEFQIHVPRCFRDWWRKRPDGSRYLPIPVSIWLPFSRSVVIEVAHTSIVSRDVSLIYAGSFYDKESKQIPSVRLVASDTGKLTQTVDKGGVAKFILRFEGDKDEELKSGTAEMMLQAPGMSPIHIPVELLIDRPLLGPKVRIVMWLAAGCAAVLGSVALIRRFIARRLRAGRMFSIPYGQPVSGLFSLKPTRNHEVVVQTLRPVRIGHQSDDKLRPIAEHRSLRLDRSDLRQEDPIIVSEDASEGAPPLIVALTPGLEDEEGLPQMSVEVVSAGIHSVQAAVATRKARKYLLMAAIAAALAINFFHPGVIRAFQFLVDFVHPR